MPIGQFFISLCLFFEGRRASVRPMPGLLANDGALFISLRDHHLELKSPMWAFFLAVALSIIARGKKKIPI
jgi:hypothetical protein